MEKHIAIYVRVSTKQQDHKSQLPDLEKWAKGQELPVIYYKDKFTGRTMDRPGWNKLQAAMSRGEVATVVCWRLDRLGRTLSGLAKLFDDLKRLKINLVSVKDSLDLSTAAGRLMAGVLASAAVYQVEISSERILAGQAAARDEGKRWGGSKPGRLIKTTPEQLKTVLELNKAGEKKSVIARTVGLSRQTVYQLLGNHAN